VRYTPITEIYREVVQLSQAIARHQPSSSVSLGSKDVLGVLIDMAEVWELYVYHLLRSSIREAEVLHVGRDTDADNFLLRSERTGDPPSRLRGVPFFMKQMTGKTPIPADLMIRQFPKHSRRPVDRECAFA
jgi:hypothetical protein